MKNENIEILLVTDTRYEQDNIQQLLLEEYGQILQATNETAALQLFKKHHPSLLIISYEEVDKAKAFYLSLYIKDKKIYDVPHKTILLCRGKESHKAYELCVNSVISDYVADRPMFDPYRLRLSVRQAIESHKREQNAFWHSNQIDKITEDLNQLYKFVVEKLKSMGGEQKDTVTSFNNYTKKLSTDIKSLEQSIAPLCVTDVENENDAVTMTKGFSQFSSKSIKSGSKKVLKQLNKTNNSMANLNKGLLENFDSIHHNTDIHNITKILIVDDDPFYCEMVIEMLKSETINVSSATDGRSALDDLRFNKPDIILLDYMMADLDGLMVLKIIKSNPNLKSIPVIMLTGDSSRTVVSNCMKAGAVEFLIKPSDRVTLLSKIEKVLA